MAQDEARRVEMHAAVGGITARLANLEHWLGVIFAQAMGYANSGSDFDLPFKILNAAKNFQTQMKMIDIAVSHRCSAANPSAVDRWRALKKWVGHVKEHRDLVAHGSLAYRPAEDFYTISPPTY